jgi:hypothetical protein
MTTLGPDYKLLAGSLVSLDTLWMLGRLESEKFFHPLKNEEGPWMIRGNLTYVLRDPEYVRAIILREAEEMMIALSDVKYDDARAEAVDMLPFELLESVQRDEMGSWELRVWEDMPLSAYRAIKAAVALIEELPSEERLEIARNRVERYLSRGYVRRYVPRELENSDHLFFLLIRLYCTAIWMEHVAWNTSKEALRRLLGELHPRVYAVIIKTWEDLRGCAADEEYRRKNPAKNREEDYE